jgi:hypothetical protein
VELAKIPAYARAERFGREIEENVRGAAFLSTTEKICGIEVVSLTMRIFRRLKAARSPFLVGGRRPRAGDCVAFLWAVSSAYNLKSKRAREQAKQKLIERAASLTYRRTLRGIRRYLFYAWMDRPPAARGVGSGAAVTFEAAMIHHLASVYGWDDEAILDKPLRRLHQYLTMIRVDVNPRAVTFNPIVQRLTKPVRAKLLARHGN